MIRTYIFCFAVVIMYCAFAAGDEPKAKLDCNERGGISLRTPAGELLLDAAPTLTLFDKQGKTERQLDVLKIQRPDENTIELECAAELPGGVKVKTVRRISVARRAGEAELVEDFSLVPDKRIAADLEVRWPFRLVVNDGPEVSAVFPTYDGYAKPYPLSEEFLRGQWRMGNEITQLLSAPLGLPAVQFGAAGRWLAGVYADPEFAAMFEISVRGSDVVGAIRYRYASSIIPLAAGETESRRFGLWFAEEDAKKGIGPISAQHPPGRSGKLDRSPFSQENEEFGRSIDAFFRLMMPDAPPGPRWLHDIAMVSYDYLSDDGKGWERDVRELARLLKSEERRRVALCLHGWYDNLGDYSFDWQNKRMKPQWTAMAHTRKVPMSVELVKQRLRLARELGFHTLLYFGDGLLHDDGAAGYHADWDLTQLDGKRILSGWCGPDTCGKNYARNPAHPEVVQWYQDYLAALIDAFGSELDGFVWDETFYITSGMKTLRPTPAYCDRAMFRLVKKLTAQVEAYDPQKVFLVSDLPCADNAVSGNAMVADGTYQDSGCWPNRWQHGLFPNWRNTLWSCNWYSVTRFERTKLGVETFRVPVAISNGWHDDRGPAEWTDADREKILALFRWRLAQGPRVRYLNVDQTTP